MEIEYREREALLEDLDRVFIIDENNNIQHSTINNLGVDEVLKRLFVY